MKVLEDFVEIHGKHNERQVGPRGPRLPGTLRPRREGTVPPHARLSQSAQASLLPATGRPLLSPGR